ncbi:hypothetical protein A9Q96_12335 [Rhodobacterales bacterium 52_120_T64]|nr:hypothetical protein A9Q96_12335 [Rhodobacterales bacterium 52_120_T64]
MICSFDIGGSKIVAAEVDASLNVTEIHRAAPPVSDFEGFCELIVEATPQSADAIGISIAGVANPVTGIITCSNIPAIHGRSLQQHLTNRFKKAVYIMNDANAFGLAESVDGCAIGHDTVFAAILGTGVGGALVHNQRVVEGVYGTAGEWGHGPAAAIRTGVALPVFECGCGQAGCVDTHGGARGLERLHNHFSGENLTSHQIVSAWKTGDLAASGTIDVYIDVVGGALANVVNIIGPSIVPVGGGMARDTQLIQALDNEVRKRCLAHIPSPLLHPTTDGPEKGLIGAALYAMEKNNAANA